MKDPNDPRASDDEFTRELPPEAEPGDQVGLSVDSLDYLKAAEVRMVPGADGMPTLAGATMNPSPPPGLTDENLVCIAGAGRPVCVHYRAVLLDAHGTTSGFAQPKQLRRYCAKLASQSELMELSEVNVYACTVREPVDPRSAQVLEAFEERQREAAAKGAQTSDTFEV